MRWRSAIVVTSIAAVAGFAVAGDGETALDKLSSAPMPHFRPGHTLPPLTRWGWNMPFDVRVALSDHWGYALELGGDVTSDLVKELGDPNSVVSRICALAASDPKRYALSVTTVHQYPGDPPDSACCHDAQGNLPDGKKIWSPEAPDDVFRKAAESWAGPLKDLRDKAPIAVILNGGEYALSVYGHHGRYWESDPKVPAAKGSRDWYDYVSERKAHQEGIISDAFRQAAPDRTLYLYYYTDGCPHRGRTSDWWTWAWDYKQMRSVSDIPNSSLYYLHFNSGWTGDNDLLTQALNAAAQQIAAGDALSYNWVCAGWMREELGEKAFSDPDHYMGFLKCCYTAGMIGGVAGYFSYPREDDPQWLWQMMVLGHVHALFSHFEDFLRQGDLLPGPLQHRWSTELPAYELPTGDPTLRVLARKRREQQRWLIAAWAAGGEERDATVEIPDLGTVTLHARPGGSVYLATLAANKPSLTLIDKDGMNPTADM